MAQPQVVGGYGYYPLPAARPSELPVVEREYHEFYRAPRFRWWQPLVALAGFALIWFGLSLVLSLAVVLNDLATGQASMDDLVEGQLTVTPQLFLANNVVLALAIPLAVAAHRLVFGQRTGYLFSIEGRFRWGLFGRFLVVPAVLYTAFLGVSLALEGIPEGLAIRPETWFLLGTVLLTTPLQCAGEEVALRGLGARAIGSWFGSRRVGLVVATAVTSVVFMAVHGTGDPWLNLHYVVFAVVASVLVWRTGGLEAPIALHVVNNLTGLLFIPFTGVEGIFDREAGVGSPWVLLQVAVVVGAGAGILWQARRLGLPTSTAPAAPAGAVAVSSFPAPGPAGGDRGE